MLDTTTLRVSFTAIALTVGTLLGLTLLRGSRSAYAAWWCLSILLFLVGDALFLADGSASQWLTNPAGDTLVVAGTAAAWGGARTLHSRRPPLWQLLAGPVVSGVAAAVDHPGADTWAGGPVFLLSMAAYFGLGCVETLRVVRPAIARRSTDRVYETLVSTLATAFGALALFYLGRCAGLLGWGASSPRFERWFGSSPTTLIQMLLLVVVAFTMSSLVSEQKVRELHVRASHDSLTGLLNRGEFLRRAQDRLLEAQRDGMDCVVVMADLDLFKSVNDRFGHGAGDRVLRSFARACTVTVRPNDLVGRLGGEEFALFLYDTEPSDAARTTREITRRFQAMRPLPDAMPTASYGIAPLEAGLELGQLLERADVALYRAKAAGRDRAAHYRG